MFESIDVLYARWQENPDASRTAALCDALRGSRRLDLVDIVGNHAARQLDVPALVAAARMYTDTGRLEDAQQVLISAGRLAPRDGEVFRWLGEVLLRRGDAERAEKVLERAVQIGGSAQAQTWLTHARTLLTTQRSSGMMAVAHELAQMIESGAHEAPDADELETQIRGQDEVRAALSKAGLALPAAGRAPAPPPANRTRPLDDGLFGLGQTAGVGLPQPDFGAHAAPLGGGTAAFGGGPPSSTLMRAAKPVLPELPVNPKLLPQRPPAPSSHGRVPEPRDVLEALQIAGVYEPDGAVSPVGAWAAPERGRRRIGSLISLITLAAVTVGGATGAYYYVKDKRAKQHVEAEAMLAQVDADLAASNTTLLESVEQRLGQAFDLESRSPHAALTWVHERAMLGLLKGGENVAFEDSVQRAKEVGIPEKQLAFANVASFLFQGDTAGAAAAVAKWDSVASDDAWFQLVAGATFERAGDARAVDRYAAATKLDPSVLAAQMLLVRTSAVDGDAEKASEVAKEFRTKYPTRPEGAALVTLAWARNPARGEPPAEAKEVSDKPDALPMPLKAVPYAARALLALETHKIDEAKTALTKGLAVSDTPGIASWLGGIALTTGDEALARKAALAAVSYSAVYPPARVLAARVALLGARLDEALKAAEELPPASPDVAVVTAAVAYEKLDGERMSRALEAVPDDVKKRPFLVPLVRGQALLGGNPAGLLGDKAVAMADDDFPWADLVAMDAALDTGDLDTAAKIAAQWAGDSRPLRALRLARLARYQGKLEDADKYSRAALEGTVTLRTLTERVFSLIAAGKAHDAVVLFKTYPNVGGPLAKWLRAYAVASNGKVEEARASIAQEDPPPPLSPMPSRIIAAAAYGATKDARHGADYVKSIAQAGFANPDVAAAAEKVGAGKPAPPKRK
ncbi:TPR repeat protein [Labilithrix luteola]|uniref:TPR repeat protein n=1 Tax=Labilithrix luteola TaxID=1391654 RepID=A0A0K1QDU5_9BACT|nr:tetratricopeptide repeat protein [Labilithrix luteola]AKV03893.1 TPR repeat protein [Labilithrix luteola]